MANPFLQILLSLLNKESIEYAILRGYDNIPDSMSGGDLDIWIRKQQYRDFIIILKECLAKTDASIVSFLDNNIAPKVTILGNTFGLQIDICLEPTSYKCANYLPKDYIPNSIIKYKGYSVVDKKADALLAFLKEILYNNKCKKEEYFKNAQKYVLTHTTDVIYKDLSIFSPKTKDLFINVLENNLVNDIPRLSHKMRNDLISPQQIFYNYRNQIKKIKRIIDPTGYVIAVEGTDGSGKSFIINSISPILNEAFHNGIIYNHLRPHYLPDIAELVGKRKRKEDGATLVVSDPHAEKPSGIMGSLVRWSYYMIDYTFGYLRKVWLPIHSKSKVFIFDRYYYEYYLDQRRSHVNLPMWIIRLGEFFIPKPDLILCLGGDPEKIYARKPETSLQEVTRQTKVLKDFCSKRKNAVWIDTTVAPEESINAAMKAINEMMSKRFDINDLQ